MHAARVFSAPMSCLEVSLVLLLLVDGAIQLGFVMVGLGERLVTSAEGQASGLCYAAPHSRRSLNRVNPDPDRHRLLVMPATGDL